MRPDEILRLVDVIHRDKNIDRELIFSTLENALLVAARKYYGAKDNEELNISITIDRNTGRVIAQKDGQEIDPEMLGRISAHAAKQSIIQRIREAESKVIFQEYSERIGELEVGTVQRVDRRMVIVSLGRTEALLPPSEQIPGESFQVGQRVKAIIRDVELDDHRVRIILSRSHPDFVRRLFEQEIPEIQDRTIDIRAIAREAGYRTKIAVSSIDTKVDAAGACIGVRGSRVKNIVDELHGERIDVVKWNEDLQILIKNALQPAKIQEEVFLYPRLDRAIVLVQDDQLSLAIGRRGQNVRLASKLVGWDIEVMTPEEYSESLTRAKQWFLQIPGMTDEMAEVLITEGFLSYDDLSYMKPHELAELIGVTEEEAFEMTIVAEELSEQVQLEKQEQERVAAAEPKAEAKPEAAEVEQPLAAEAATVSEPQHTLESLFGPEALKQTQEEKLDPHKIFGIESQSDTAKG